MARKRERGSEATRALLDDAERVASERGAFEVGSVELLLGMLEVPAEEPLGALLRRHGLAREVLESALAPLRPASAASLYRAPPGPLAPTPEVAALLAHAGRRVALAGRAHIEPEDLLACLLEDRAAHATRLLEHLGLDRARIRAEAEALSAARSAEASAATGGGEGSAAACVFHAGPGSCKPADCSLGAIAGCSAHEGPAPLPGLAGDVRDLARRLEQLADDTARLARRTDEIVRYLRVLWAGSLALAIGAGALAWWVFGPGRG